MASKYWLSRSSGREKGKKNAISEGIITPILNFENRVSFSKSSLEKRSSLAL